MTKAVSNTEALIGEELNAVLGAPRKEQIAYLKALFDERDALLVRLSGMEEARKEAERTVTLYYEDHVEPGDPPCPCVACEKARGVFATALADA